MLEKEMYLRKTINFFLYIFVIFFFNLSAKADEISYKNKVINYLNLKKGFSSSFLQINNNQVSEGYLFLQNEKLRIEYTNPTNIIFILTPKKAMYFNKDLEEVEYFHPKKTSGKIFLDFFYDPNFVKNTKVTKGNNYFYLSKEIKIKKTIYKIDIYFEETPVKLRKIELTSDGDKTSFTIVNPNYNPELSKEMFSLINPLLG